MAYNKEQIEEKFSFILDKISEEGMSVRKVLKLEGMPSSRTFFKWLLIKELDSDEDKLIKETRVKQYACACSDRADFLFDEIICIADDSTPEDIPVDRLRVDARKWVVSKMNPKKYGDKMDVTTQGDKINSDFKVSIVQPDDES